MNNAFYKYNFDILNQEDIMYYLLGAFLTDGCLNDHKITLSTKDQDWLENINKFICPQLPVKNYGTSCYRTIYCQSKFVNWFKERCLTSNKSLTLKFPNVPKEYMADFLRGCWDGDGSLTFHTKYRLERNKTEIVRKANICSGSLHFINAISNELYNQNIEHKLYHLKVDKPCQIEGREVWFKNTYYNLDISRLVDLYKFVKFLYYKDHKISLNRKNILANQIIDNYENSSILNKDYQFDRLAPKDIKDIRDLLFKKETYKNIANIYGVNPYTIKRIDLKLIWKNII